jgi:hypothetical protein
MAHRLDGTSTQRLDAASGANVLVKTLTDLVVQAADLLGMSGEAVTVEHYSR